MQMHAGVKPHKCPYCPESFFKKEYLARHLRFHGAAVKVHRCDICNKELAAASYLQDHIRRVHSKIAQCEICKTQMPREELKAHQQNLHQPLPCGMCNKIFYLPRQLIRHEHTHTANYAKSRKQECEFCGNDYSARNIKSHVFKKHPSEFTEWQASLIREEKNCFEFTF